MRRRILGAACLIGSALAAAASAQGTGDAVLLRYRFQPGQEFHYRLTLNGDLGMSFSGITPPPGAHMPPRTPMTMTGTYEFSQKVRSVTPEGAAVVSLGIDKMELTTDVMGMNVVARLGADGKMETVMNGKPMRLPNAPPVNLSHPIFEATIDPVGKISGVTPEATNVMNQLFAGQNIASMFNGMPGMGGLLLPSQPVKAGDTWDNNFDLRIPLPSPGMGGAAAGGLPAGAMLTEHIAVHNKLLRVENGSAVIETRMTAAVPTGTTLAIPAPAAGPAAGMKVSIDKMLASATGTHRFNLDQGTAEGSDLGVDLAVVTSLALPPGMRPGAAAPAGHQNGRARLSAHTTGSGTTAHQPGSAAPTHLKIATDGTMKLKMERLTTPPAPPTAPAAPSTALTAPSDASQPAVR
jgi:hypothetical protein